MKYAVIFVANSCRYTCHASTCSQAVTKTHRMGGSEQHRVPQEFDSIQAARDWADEDEWQKRDTTEPAKGLAIWRVCKCAKTVTPVSDGAVKSA